MLKHYLLAFAAFLAAASSLSYAQSRETILLNDGWSFNLADASSPANRYDLSPVLPEYDESDWQSVVLPHDWALGLDGVDWHYPKNSLGWYRKHFSIAAEDKGRIVTVLFDGIFSDSQVYCNGYYLGGERGGYISQTYDLTPYLNFGGDNVLAVRADASLNVALEGAGICRDVYLVKTGPIRFDPMTFKVKVSEGLGTDLWLNVSSKLHGDIKSDAHTFGLRLYNAEGQLLIDYRSTKEHRAPSYSVDFRLPKELHTWSLEDPYLYTVKLTAYIDGSPVDEYAVKYGFRTTEFDPEQGFLLNGKKVDIVGANLSQYQPEVGAAISKAEWLDCLQILKDSGFNAVCCQNNPAGPLMLDVCDELGILVLEESTQFGINPDQLRQYESMVCRDRNHASIIAWSLGDADVFEQNSEMGAAIADIMREHLTQYDKTRPFACKFVKDDSAYIWDVLTFSEVQQ